MLAALIVVARALPPTTNRCVQLDYCVHTGREYSQLRVVWSRMDTELHKTCSLSKLNVLRRVQGVGSFRSFSAQSDSGMAHPLAVPSQEVLRPRFASIIDHFGRARSRKLASARRCEARLRLLLCRAASNEEILAENKKRRAELKSKVSLIGQIKKPLLLRTM